MPNIPASAVERYKDLWELHREGVSSVYMFCMKVDCTDEDYELASTQFGRNMVADLLRSDSNTEAVREIFIKSPPCHDEDQARQLGFQSVCDFLRNISTSNNFGAMLKLLKYSKQAPTVWESREEYNAVFGSLEVLEQLEGFYPRSSEDKDKYKRLNAFLPLCKFEGRPAVMTFNRCDLFRRSFTNKGLGYSFNTERTERLLQAGASLETQIKTLHLSPGAEPRLMTGASPHNALTVIIENNLEEIFLYEKSQNKRMKPKPVSVVLHDPSQPGNILTKSLEIPLGHSSKVYITPRATLTDLTAQTLSEKKRNCRLRSETGGLKTFQLYSREACMLECQMEQAVERCGCYPWDFPINTPHHFYLCDNFGTVCFNSVMENVSVTLGCDCPMDCDSVSYSYSIVSNPLSGEEECLANGKESIFEEFYKAICHLN